MTVDADTSSDGAANLMVTPIIHAGHWLDEQWQNTAAVNAYEGTLDSTRITGMKLDVNIHTVSTPPAGMYNYLISYFGFAIIPLQDTGDEGDPDDWSPIALPNLFLRDWGHLSAWETTGPDFTELGPALHSTRVVYRKFYNFPWGEANEDRGEVGILRYAIRLRGFTIPRNAAFCLIAGSKNSHATDTAVLAHYVAGTFGYIHRKRG